MAKKILLQIPQPCHENWNEMITHDKGRFCNSCQKSLIDFSLMTEEQLVNYFKKAPEHVCGRFSAEQLNREINVPVRSIPWLTYFFKISIPLFLLSVKSTAQQVLTKNNTVMIVPEKKPEIPFQPKTSRTIEGVVKDITGSAVPYATVMISGTNEGTITDSAGHFSLRVKTWIKFLNVSVIGYQMQKVNIDNNRNFFEVILETRMVKGMVGVVVVKSTKKKSRKNKSLSEIKSNKLNPANAILSEETNTVSVFPNPANIYSTITLRWKQPINNDQLLEMFDINGELISKEKISITKAVTSEQVRLDLKNTGNYFIRITDSRTKKSISTQLLVN